MLGAEIQLSNLFSQIYLNRPKNFSNARFVRNIFEKSQYLHATRISTAPNKTDELLNTIENADIPEGDYFQIFC